MRFTVRAVLKAFNPLSFTLHMIVCLLLEYFDIVTAGVGRPDFL